MQARQVYEPCWIAADFSCGKPEARSYFAQKLRGGPPASGVEGLPETGCPLDPGPGLGGNLSLGLFWAKASPFLYEFPTS
jgi:hypothetical protein